MKAYVLEEKSGLDDLKQVELPEPQPAPGQVLIKMSAASLNYRDLMIATGNYGALPPGRLIPLSDGAGEVVAVADGVQRVKTGDRVCGIFMPDWIAGPPTAGKTGSALGGSVDGVLAEYVALPAESVVKVPESLSDEEASTLPCAAVTAWHALVEDGRVKAGQTVLLLGTGGVSTFGLLFAKASGARAIITSSSDEKLAKAHSLGAEETINYKSVPDWEKRVLELTGGEGVDHVLEVGGEQTFPKSIAATRVYGHVYVIGGVSGFNGQVSSGSVLRKSLRVHGIYVGSREMFDNMNAAIAANSLRPVVDRVFPFGEARAAYEYMESGSHFGKVVIKF